MENNLKYVYIKPNHFAVQLKLNIVNYTSIFLKKECFKNIIEVNVGWNLYASVWGIISFHTDMHACVGTHTLRIKIMNGNEFGYVKCLKLLPEKETL